MHVRPFIPDDAAAIVDVYRDAARGLGSQAYSPEQIAVWASFPEDFAAFCQQISRGVTLVAVEAGNIAAFGQLDPKDHIAFLYTRTCFARQGYATAIYRLLEAAARERDVYSLTTMASRVSKPLFTKEGFEVTSVDRSPYKGVEFELFAMAKRLAPVG